MFRGKKAHFIMVMMKRELLGRRISHSFPSLSCLNCTQNLHYQTARLSIGTAEFCCYCCTFRVSIQL